MKTKPVQAVFSAILLCIFFFFPLLVPFQAAAFSLYTAKAEPTPAVETAQKPVQGTYACILGESFFYSAPNENSGLFLLPKTYYVRLLEYGMEYCKIEYLTEDSYTKKLLGYAKTNELTFVDYVPQRPYLYHYFEITSRIDDVENPSSSFLDQIVMTCAYYGDYKVGSKTYCYVLRSGEFGYVPKPSRISFEENTEYAEYLASKTPATDQENGKNAAKKNKSSPAQIAILVIVCLLVPLLAGLIIKPPKRSPYDMEE